MTQLSVNVDAADIEVPCPYRLNDDRYAPSHIEELPADFPCYANRRNHIIELPVLLSWITRRIVEMELT